MAFIQYLGGKGGHGDDGPLFSSFFLCSVGQVADFLVIYLFIIFGVEDLEWRVQRLYVYLDARM